MDRQITSLIASELGYVSVDDWCEFEKNTPSAINIRVSRGYWQRGIHVIKPAGGKSMVCLEAAKAWLEKERSRKG